MDQEFRVSRWELLPLEQISNEVLLYSTGNYIQSLVIEHDRIQYEEKNMYIYICIMGSPCYKQILIKHCKSTIIKNFFQRNPIELFSLILVFDLCS